MEEQTENKDFMPKAQVEIMLEDIRSDFKVFGEGLNDVRRELGEVKGTVALILEDIDEIKSDIVEMKSDIVEMKSDIVEMKSDIVEIKSDIVEIKSDIVEIREELSEVNGKLDNKAEKNVTDNHETRIVKLEKSSLANA